MIWLRTRRFLPDTRAAAWLLATLAAGASACNPGAGEARAMAEACAGGDLAACNQLAWKVQEGEHVLRDWRRAADLYLQACDGGEAEACVRLARLHVHPSADSRGLTHDSLAASGLLRKGCEGGAMSGCADLADMYAAGDSMVPGTLPMGVRQDIDRAARLYRRACDGGDLRGCTLLGLLHQDGRGVAPDPVRASALFDQACGGGSALGCSHLGRSYETGMGVGVDVERAAVLYEEACAVEVTGCYRLADLMTRAEPPPEDYERVLELFDAACYRTESREEGSDPIPESCVRAGDILATGIGGERDLDRASRYFRRACGLGHQEACARS